MKVELSEKELNYIETSLRHRIQDLSRMDGLGNVPHLIRFSKKLYRKLRLLRGYPATWRIRYSRARRTGTQQADER